MLRHRRHTPGRPEVRQHDFCDARRGIHFSPVRGSALKPERRCRRGQANHSFSGRRASPESFCTRSCTPRSRFASIAAAAAPPWISCRTSVLGAANDSECAGCSVGNAAAGSTAANLPGRSEARPRRRSSRVRRHPRIDWLGGASSLASTARHAYPLNTMAGSRLRILLMPSHAASQQMKRIAASETAGSCQGMKNGGIPLRRTINPNSVARPTPQP